MKMMYHNMYYNFLKYDARIKIVNYVVFTKDRDVPEWTSEPFPEDLYIFLIRYAINKDG